MKDPAGTHQLESRMREIRPSGSEGGVALCAIPTPMDGGPLGLRREREMRRIGQIGRMNCVKERCKCQSQSR